MRSHFSIAVFLVVGVCGWLSTLGCTGSPASKSNRPATAAQFLLAEEPADTKGVMECRDLLEEGGEPVDLNLVGRVGGLSQPTWEPDRAVFMMADMSLKQPDDHGDVAPGHDVDNCPYCRANRNKELAGLAMIEVIDADGKIPSTGAQDLLGLSEGQAIVVQGTAKLDKLGTLLVRTGGIFIRPSEE